MKTFFIFFILVFGNGSCKILKDNILFLISNQTNDQNLITVFGVTRGRFGSNILIISPNNQSLENSLVVGIFTMNYINYQYRYQNFNFTSKPFQIDPNANGLLVPSQDPNYYPIGRDFNDYMLNITLKKNVFQSLFPETFWVFVGFTYSSPFDEYNFDTRFYPPFGENISFETQIQNETPFYQLEYPYLRLEILNVSVYVLYLIFLILLFIICIIFSQKEPLKSRGFIPYLSLMLQFIHLFTEFPFFFITLENAHFLCIPYYFFQSSASLLLTLLSLIHYFRLITYFNLNKRKDFLIQNSDPTDSKIYIFIKYMLKWYTMILIMFLFYLIISAIFLREYISDGYRCEKRDFHQIVYTSFVVLFSLIGILLIGYDLMSCLDKVRKFQCCDFWLEDTLLMRAEIYIFGGFFTLGFWIVSSAVSVNNPLVQSVLNSMSLYLILVFHVIFPLIITIFKTIVFQCKKPKELPLEKTLEDPEKKYKFYQFSRNEYSGEYNMCFEEIQKYKSEDISNRASIANRIMSLYLNGLFSELEISIPFKEQKELKDKISKNQLESNLFDNVEKMIKNQLELIYRRTSL